MTRRLPRGAGSETTLESARPVLIVGPESSSIGRTAHLLEAAGFAVVAIFGRLTLDLARERWAPLLAVIDLEAGWAVHAGTHLHRAGVRVIALSDDEVAQLRALRNGFVEALPKSISPEGLVARIRALVSLPQEVPAGDYATGLLRIDPLDRSVAWDGTALDLAKSPFDLLKYLADRSGMVVPKAQLKRDFQWVDDNSLHQAIWRLRNELGPVVARHVVTRPRYGYGFFPQIPTVAQPARGVVAVRRVPAS